MIGLAAFAIAVACGLFAAVALLINLSTGIAGFYSDGWVIAFFASAGAMIALFIVAIGVGLSALKRRGAAGGRNRSHLFVAFLELGAIAGLVAAVELGIGGYGVPLIADLLVLAFIGGLVRWNIEIWRRLKFPIHASEREPVAN